MSRDRPSDLSSGGSLRSRLAGSAHAVSLTANSRVLSFRMSVKMPPIEEHMQHVRRSGHSTMKQNVLKTSFLLSFLASSAACSARSLDETLRLRPGGLAASGVDDFATILAAATFCAAVIAAALLLLLAAETCDDAWSGTAGCESFRRPTDSVGRQPAP